MKDWSREELNASVVAYIKMRELEKRGERFVKKKYYEKLSKRYGRSVKAFEYRMQNISHVYDQLGRDWIKTLKPKKNVGTNVIQVIEELIYKNEEVFANPKLKFEEQVYKLRQKKNFPEPSGKKSPKKQTRKTTYFERNPGVVAWVLENSKGKCEKCKKPAPFKKVNGDFYLEVHHLKRLVDGGSDTITNAIAVCPNCHRELHFASKREELLNRLYQKISRLKQE